MVRRVIIKKGLDIPIPGSPEQTIECGPPVKTVALLGADYAGLKPRVLVEPGQVIGLGEPLILDKRNTAVQFTAPGTGRVIAVNRGRRRALQSVVIELDESAAPEKIFDVARLKNQADIRELLLKSGAWTSFRTRPFEQVPGSGSSPRSLFVTAIDTRPLAADPAVVIAARMENFALGLETVTQLSTGSVYFCTGPDWQGPEPSGIGVQRVEFDGPHPAGLAGTHIHYLDPVAADRSVWHIDYQDVIAIGHLCSTGRLSCERVIALGGPGVLRPRLLRTRSGANIAELLEGELVPDGNCRLISGSVLDGCVAAGPVAFLGRYHSQIAVIGERTERRRFGWFEIGSNSFGLAGRIAAARHTGTLSKISTALNGRQVAMLPTEAFERVMPLDILPVPLFRALLIKDTDTAQALGCLELAEDDLALSSFVCPAKQDYGAALRINLDYIEKEG